MYPDRVITIKGTIDNMSAAEASISLKLRECIEKEMQVGWSGGDSLLIHERLTQVRL